MLRSTWEKTSNPILRAVTFLERPRVQTRRKFMLPRPKGSPYTRPVAVHLYYNGSMAQLEQSVDLWLDVPGGGFVCMTPVHHEERLLSWALATGKPILAIEYSKAPGRYNRIYP
jgi:hypothetical protein